MNVAVFVYCAEDSVECVKLFKTPEAALSFAIPFVAEKVGYTLTGDDNVDWDVLNTELEHPGRCWQLIYNLTIE